MELDKLQVFVSQTSPSHHSTTITCAGVSPCAGEVGAAITSAMVSAWVSTGVTEGEGISCTVSNYVFFFKAILVINNITTFTS